MTRSILCAAALAVLMPLLPLPSAHARDAFCATFKRVMAQRHSKFKRIRGKKGLLGIWGAAVTLPGMGHCTVDDGTGQDDGASSYSCEIRTKTRAEAEREITRLAQQTLPCLRHVRLVRSTDPGGFPMISFQSRPNFSTVWLGMDRGIEHGFKVSLNIGDW
jgi:hypothetical protein